MPRVDPDRHLDAPGQRYSLRKSGWIRDRILVFVTGDDGETAERAVQQIQYVSMLPRTEDRAFVFLPATHYVLQMETTKASALTRSLKKKLVRPQEELGVHLEPVIHERQLNGGGTGILAGTGLHLPQDPSQRRGLLGLELDGTGVIHEAMLTLVRDAEGVKVGFYHGQTVAMAGVDPAFPARFDIAAEAALSTLNNARVLVLQKPSPGARPTVSFQALCSTALGLLSGEEEVRAPSGTLYSLLKSERKDEFRPKTVDFDAANGWARVEVGAEMSHDRLGRVGAGRCVLHVRPDMAYTRLLHSDARLGGGGFAVIGLLLPLPGVHPGVMEAYCHLDRGQQLTAHALDLLETTLYLEQPGGLLSRLRGPVARCVTDDGPTGKMVRLEKRLNRVAPLTVSVHLGLKAPVPPVQIENRETALEPMEEAFALLMAEPNRVFGYFRSPVATDAAPGDPGCLRAPVTLARSSPEAKDTVCIDWLDDAAGVILRDESGWTERVGLAEYLMRRRGFPDTDPMGAQALVLSKAPKGRLSLHLEDKGPGDQTILTPVVHDGIYRIGPLLCRYRQAQPVSQGTGGTT